AGAACRWLGPMPGIGEPTFATAMDTWHSRSMTLPSARRSKNSWERACPDDSLPESGPASGDSGYNVRWPPRPRSRVVRHIGGHLMRTRIAASVMTVLLFVSFSGMADEKDKAVEKELAKMQGIWCRGLALEFSHRDGDQYESRPLDKLEKSHRIQGNKWIM